LNAQKKQFEERGRLVEAMRKIVGNVDELVMPHRSIKSEANVSWSTAAHKNIKGLLFIFNDGVMYTKKKGNKEKVVQVIKFAKDFTFSKEKEKGITVQPPEVKFAFNKTSERDSAYAAIEISIAAHKKG